MSIDFRPDTIRVKRASSLVSRFALLFLLVFSCGIVFVAGCSTSESGHDHEGHDHDHDHDHDGDGDRHVDGDGHDSDEHGHAGGDGHDGEHAAGKGHDASELSLREQVTALKVSLVDQRSAIQNATAAEADALMDKIIQIEAKLNELNTEVERQERAAREGHDKHDH